MINTQYSIENNLKHVKLNDLIYHSVCGYLKVIDVNEKEGILTDERYVRYSIKDGRIVYPDGHTNLSENSAIFEGIIYAINYFTYYQHFMTNDRNLDPQMK